MPTEPKIGRARYRKLSSAAMKTGNCAQSNRVFLLENHSSFPYLRPVAGWKIIGYGKAPWPGSTDGFAVMFEKIAPAEEKDNIFAKEHLRCDEGTRIWQHMNRNHFNAYISSMNETPIPKERK